MNLDVSIRQALKELNIRVGDFVTIIGAAGGLGHLAVQYAVAMGYRVIGKSSTLTKIAYSPPINLRCLHSHGNFKQAGLLFDTGSRAHGRCSVRDCCGNCAELHQWWKSW
jgi:hypothetical protein